MDIDGALSRTKSGSEISRLNRDKEAILSQETYDLLKEALSIADRTEGAFDPAIGALTSLWGIGTENARVPEDQEIAAADTDWRHIAMDDATRKVSLPKNMEIDLGGIGKGYAADRMTAYLKENGVTHALINLGGNIYALGTKTKEVPWTIGLRDPDGETGSAFATLSVSDVSIVTSGPYERFFEKDGVRYHHILDRATGYPAESGLSSVTVIGKESTLCDALSTAVFVLGKEKGLALVTSCGYACVLVDTEGDVAFSEDFPYPCSLL